MKVKILKAENGDCLIISYQYCERNINILVDGGVLSTKNLIKSEMQKILDKGENLEAIIITHIDHDHIKGLLNLFNTEYELIKNLKIKKILCSYYRKENIDNYRSEISIKEGNDFCAQLNAYITKLAFEDNNAPEILVCLAGDEFTIGDGRLTIVSPQKSSHVKLMQALQKSDYKVDNIEYKETSDCISVTKCDHNIKIQDFSEKIQDSNPSLINESSIAFIIEQDGKNALFMGDACPEKVIDSIKENKNIRNKMKNGRLNIDLIKLSHHGGESSISEKYIKILKCSKYIVSTNGKYYKHPRKKTLVDIIRNQEDVVFYFNYSNIFKKSEMLQYSFCVYENYEDEVEI